MAEPNDASAGQKGATVHCHDPTLLFANLAQQLHVVRCWIQAERVRIRGEMKESCARVDCAFAMQLSWIDAIEAQVVRGAGERAPTSKLVEPVAFGEKRCVSPNVLPAQHGRPPAASAATPSNSCAARPSRQPPWSPPPSVAPPKGCAGATGGFSMSPARIAHGDAHSGTESKVQAHDDARERQGGGVPLEVPGGEGVHLIPSTRVGGRGAATGAGPAAASGGHHRDLMIQPRPEHESPSAPSLKHVACDLPARNEDDLRVWGDRSTDGSSSSVGSGAAEGCCSGCGGGAAGAGGDGRGGVVPGVPVDACVNPSGGVDACAVDSTQPCATSGSTSTTVSRQSLMAVAARPAEVVAESSAEKGSDGAALRLGVSKTQRPHDGDHARQVAPSAHDSAVPTRGADGGGVDTTAGPQTSSEASQTKVVQDVEATSARQDEERPGRDAAANVLLSNTPPAFGVESGVNASMGRRTFAAFGKRLSARVLELQPVPEPAYDVARLPLKIPPVSPPSPASSRERKEGVPATGSYRAVTFSSVENSGVPSSPSTRSSKPPTPHAMSPDPVADLSPAEPGVATSPTRPAQPPTTNPLSPLAGDGPLRTKPTAVTEGAAPVSVVHPAEGLTPRLRSEGLAGSSSSKWTRARELVGNPTGAAPNAGPRVPFTSPIKTSGRGVKQESDTDDEEEVEQVDELLGAVLLSQAAKRPTSPKATPKAAEGSGYQHQRRKSSAGSVGPIRRTSVSGLGGRRASFALLTQGMKSNASFILVDGDDLAALHGSTGGSKATEKLAASLRQSLRGLRVAERAATRKLQRERTFMVTDDIYEFITKRLSERRAIQAFSPSRLGHYSAPNTPGRTVSKGVEAEVEVYIELMCHDIMSQDQTSLNSVKTARTRRRRWLDPTRLIMDPRSIRRLRWDMLMLCVLLYSSFMLPARQAFEFEPYLMVKIVDGCVDLFYTIDILVQFNTAYYDEDHILVVDHAKIATRYMKTWFLVDLLSTVRMYQMSMLGTGAPWTQTISLLKIARFFSYIGTLEDRFEGYISPTKTRLLILTVLVLLFWQWIACAFWAVATAPHIGFGSWQPETAWEADSTTLKWAKSYIWSVVTTFSYQPELPPETAAESMITLVAVLFGVCVNAIVIGAASSTLQSLDAESEKRRQRMSRISAYMEHHSIPQYFRRVVIDYYNYMYDRAAEDNVLSELPPAIQGRLQLLLNRDLVEYIPLLRELDLKTVVALMQALESHTYMPGEYVFRAGDEATSIYFLKRGALNIVLADGQTVVGRFQKGCLVGQQALLANEKHNVSVRAVIYSEALILSRSDYEDIAAISDAFAEMVQDQAAEEEFMCQSSMAGREGSNASGSSNKSGQRSGDKTAAGNWNAVMSSLIHLARLKKAARKVAPNA